MSRVVAYVDGFNLYFGLRSKGWRRYYWLDLVALARSLLKPDQTLESVHYFTSRIRANGRNVEDMRRQNVYIEALLSRPGLDLHLGHFLEKPATCFQCGARWVAYEEKMTDVNIAVQMLTDAHADRFDLALLLSADSDLTTPVRTLRATFPDKRLIAVFPPGRHSVDLGKAADASFTVGEAKLRQAQLPPVVERADGYPLARPAHWR